MFCEMIPGATRTACLSSLSMLGDIYHVKLLGDACLTARFKYEKPYSPANLATNLVNGCSLFCLDNAWGQTWSYYGNQTVYSRLPRGLYSLKGFYMEDLGLVVCNCVRTVLKNSQTRCTAANPGLFTVENKSLPADFHKSENWFKCINPTCTHLVCKDCKSPEVDNFCCSMECLRMMMDSFGSAPLPVDITLKMRCPWGLKMWLLSEQQFFRETSCSVQITEEMTNKFMLCQIDENSGAFQVDILPCQKSPANDSLLCEEHNEECRRLMRMSNEH